MHQYGLPSRVRCDREGENAIVSQFMVTHPQHGPGRRSCITGRTVHNQQIEHFWRDLFMGCVFLFYTLFCIMEDMDIVDPGSNTDVLALHHVFLPRINHSLNVFQELYSLHCLLLEIVSSTCTSYESVNWLKEVETTWLLLMRVYWRNPW